MSDQQEEKGIFKSGLPDGRILMVCFRSLFFPLIFIIMILSREVDDLRSIQRLFNRTVARSDEKETPC
ncbi:hypothetical protein C2W59_02940 [Bacillus pumilus]|uniref:hypothetical protein n=1 Tax=Bacillus pumilus TaxID=1408 RepID=UPI000DC2D67F|nr:hypothetical protein [Bacillus pumilus]RAP23360.1 hypothetical protein C2W59_02940 [Bacillus pumilus]